ncbi:MAG: ribbon-helix-helix domain-containing protein [Emcibacter sp.]|nr:ribbon-helix-helix domain-containing protein [Emcibacter sp.]
MSSDDGFLKKHSIVIAGHQTSVTLENIFWNQLKLIATHKNISLGKLVSEIDFQRTQKDRQINLSSAIRVFVLNHILTQKDHRVE